MKTNLLHKLISARRIVQGLFAAAVYGALTLLQLPLLYILALGAGLGLLFGKVFCRWMCPIGFIIELLLRRKGDSAEQMYMYHKMGCPIAWISGFLNRSSLFTIRRDTDSCTDCGICDKSCYITSLNKEFSHFKTGKKAPAAAYSCSRCLECVASCPQNSLSYSLEL